MTRSSKASLIKQLRKLDIPVPKNATVSQLEHRLKHWEKGDGFLVRRFRNMRGRESIAKVISTDSTYWVPNSRFIREILKSRLVFFLGRTAMPPADAVVLDVPENYGEEE